MARGKGRKLTFGKAFQQEMYKIGALSLLLVVIQMILSILGFTGLWNTVFMYGVATIASNMFNIDNRGIKSAKGIYLAPSAYWIYVLVDMLMMAIGVILWFTVGLIQGVGATIAHGESADDILHKMAGNNFLLKILYAFISHLTIFAFLRFWVNLYEAVYALFHYTDEDDDTDQGGRGGGRRR